MKLKKILVAVLVLTMLTALLPATALAADDEDGGGTTTSSGVELSKTATLESDGTYTIRLEAYATGEVKTTTTTETVGVPCDIVLVLDQSTSMKETMDTYTYTAQSSQKYSYQSYGDENTYYYLDSDGNYYAVSRGPSGNSGGSHSGGGTKYYYLSYTKNGTTYYLSGTSTTTTQPTNVTKNNDTIWTGVLYSRTTITGPARLDALKDAANTFISQVQQDAVKNNVDHKIAVVGFASNSDNNYTNTELLSTGSEVNYLDAQNADYEAALVSANVSGSVNSRLTTAIERVTAEGSTYADLGMEMAQKVLENRSVTTYAAPDSTTADRKTIVVFFTDGYPGRHTGARFFDGTPRSGISSKDFITVTTANGAIEAANSLKADGTTVYSIGVLVGADPAADYNFKVYTNSNATSDNLYDIGVDRDRANDLKVGYLSAEQAVNAYLHFVSSDYGAVTGTPTMETYDRSTVVNNGYYLAASSAEELSKVFETISSSINTSTSNTTCTLNANSVLKDVIGSRFALPQGFDESNVTVQTADYQGDGSFGAPQTLNGATVSVVDKTISVSGFDYSSNYVVDGSGSVQTGGKKLIVTITGILPTDDAFTGTEVNTNASTSGIYADADKTTAAAVFPRPKTILTSKSYVLDYAKAATLADLGLAPSAIVGTPSAVSGNNTVIGTYGNTVLSNGTVTYTPKTTDWKGYDSFYAFGQTTDDSTKTVAANANGNLWSKISVLPANNVYYEDDFVTSKEDEGDTVGIVYTGSWDTVGESNNNTETANNDVHGGWVENDTGLSNDTGYSDGSAHVADLSESKSATATFTFTGTGVDIYSRTNMNTGTILVTLTGSPANSTDSTEEKTVSKALAVDNKAASGDYYQVPTATFGDLAYGTYKVTLYVTTAAEGRSTYYLDGIRVYNPIQNLEETDDTVQEAYGDKELNATFTEVRELLQSGEAFIDEGSDGEATSGDYNDNDYNAIAPEHEIYLKPGQSVVIGATGGANYYIGLKSLTGVDVTAEISGGDENKSPLTIGHTTDLYYTVTPNSNDTITITNVTSASTESEGEEGETATPILAITKLRVTGTADSGDSALALLSNDEAIEAVTAFRTYSLVLYSAAPVTEEELPEESTAPETGKPEGTEPEEPAPEEPEEEEPGEVVIENPKEFGKHDDKNNDKNNDKKQPSPKHTDREWAENLFWSFKGLFGRR